MEILDNGFIKLGVATIIKLSKISAVKPYCDTGIVVVADGQAVTVTYNCNTRKRDEELLKLTNLLTTKQKKNN